MPTTNNNGNALDSSGNVAVDFVWGNFPMQPNDERADNTPTATIVVNGPQNYGWTTKSTVQSARLDVTQDSHAIATSDYSGFPSFVANSPGAGIANIYVPNVLGLTTALALDALKDNGYVAANITTASTATNSSKTVTAASRTAGSGETTITAAGHGYVTGNKVTLSSVDSSVNGTYTVTYVSSSQFKVTTTATTVLALTGLTGAAVAVSGTIKTQSVAAGTAGVALGSSITITPWA